MKDSPFEKNEGRQGLINILDLVVRGDDRGSLVALESEKSLPFPLKRVYYIFGTQAGVSRGFHAHHSLKQVLVCVSGSCRVLLDDGQCREDTILNSPDKGLLIEGVVWREMHDFSSDCVLLVLASDYYNENDYVRSYSEFLRLVG